MTNEFAGHDEITITRH